MYREADHPRPTTGILSIENLSDRVRVRLVVASSQTRITYFTAVGRNCLTDERELCQ